MAKQISEPLHNRETKAEPAAPFVRSVVELVKFTENRFVILFGNADTCIPDLDPQTIFVPAAPDQYFALMSVLQRVSN